MSQPPRQGFFVPLANGILEGAHRKAIGPAIWAFIWMIDSVTKEEQSPAGEFIGWVHGGAPTPTRKIALALQMPIRTVQSHIDRLAQYGYVQRFAREGSDSWAYAVSKSKKRIKVRPVLLEKSMIIAAQEIARPPQKPAHGAQNPAQHNKEVKTTQRQEQIPDPPSSRWLEKLECGLKLFEAAMQIGKLHPVYVSPEKTTVEVAKAIERHASRNGMSLSDAADFVRGRAEVYRNSAKGKKRGRYAKNSKNWFLDGCFEENPTDWNLADLSDDQDMAAHHLADGRRLQGYTPRVRVAQ